MRGESRRKLYSTGAIDGVLHDLHFCHPAQVLTARPGDETGEK